MKRSKVPADRSPASQSHEQATLESFRKHPKFAAEYLDAVLADGDRQEIVTALRYVADAFGGVAQLARKARLNPTTLYRTLSCNGNPELRSLTAMLAAMGLQLSVRAAGGRRRKSLGENAIFMNILDRARAEVRRGKVMPLAAVKKELGVRTVRRIRPRVAIR